MVKHIYRTSLKVDQHWCCYGVPESNQYAGPMSPGVRADHTSLDTSRKTQDKGHRASSDPNSTSGPETAETAPKYPLGAVPVPDFKKSAKALGCCCCSAFERRETLPQSTPYPVPGASQQKTRAPVFPKVPGWGAGLGLSEDFEHGPSGRLSDKKRSITRRAFVGLT